MTRTTWMAAFARKQTLQPTVSRVGSSPAGYRKVAQVTASKSKKSSTATSYESGQVAHSHQDKTQMKTSLTALVFATLIAVLTLASAANAARRSDYDQPRSHESNGSWQCYPYCAGGTYEGRPVREWLKPDGW
jgi:hypothetical protein